MRILGVSPLHDSSVAIINNGEIEVFYKEERLSKKKRDSNPFLAVERAIQEAKGPIDGAVVGSPACDHPELVTWLNYLKKRANVPIVLDLSKNHHVQHASLAFYNSGFDEAAIIVVDRSGTVHAHSLRESESIYAASYPANFVEVYKQYWQDEFRRESLEWLQRQSDNTKCEYSSKSLFGVVTVYETATTLIDQHILENGKTMGLASYGKPVENPPKLFSYDNIPNDMLFEREPLDGYWRAANRKLRKHSQRFITKENYQLYADYAYQVQQQTQEAVCSLIRKAIEKTNLKKVCITGGYGLNIVANHYYTTQFPDVEFYFEPLADDSGNSIGMAMMYYRMETSDTTVRKIKNTFIHGKPADLSKIEGEVCSVNDIAKILVNDQSVGVFNGLAESGPRALGNRSILFNPLNPAAKDIVNKIKNREWYRPFAAMVLKEDASMYFDLGNIKECPFMTISFPVLENAREIIAGVVHADNTCRIQTVSKEDGHTYELLKEFKKISGHGILLNTSFNLAGQPLIEEPNEALEILHTSNLNVVWFPEINKMVRK
jgi:carbamoyltransferase